MQISRGGVQTYMYLFVLEDISYHNSASVHISSFDFHNWPVRLARLDIIPHDTGKKFKQRERSYLLNS